MVSYLTRSVVKGMGIVSATICLSAFMSAAIAQTYPGKKPIRLIVPFAPGGGTDLIARLMTPKLAEALGATIVVDNRGGAGGTTGIETVVRASPDGYTMIFGAASYATNAALYKLPYDPVNDITPVSLACLSGYLVSVHPSVPAATTRELINYAKQKPGAINYGSSGVGGLAHLATELFGMMAGITMNHVPYKGTAPALTDLLGGQIQLVFGSVTATIPHARTNRLRGLAVTTASRLNQIPDVPTVSEALPGYEAILWYGVWGPKNLPAPVVARWNKELDALVRSADMKERMLKEGVEPAGGSPEVFKKMLQKDIVTWTKVARQAGLAQQAIQP